jgi:trimeric autotransporter adhesin
MRKKSIIVLSLLAFFVWTGPSFSNEESEGNPREVMQIPKTVEDATLEPQGSEITSNTYYGLSAGASSSGNNNSFFGAFAGQNNTKYGTTFVGYLAGRDNVGNSLLAVGYYAGYLNQGDDNTFMGTSSGNNNTTGHDNTFVGRLSGRSNVTDSYNTFVGSSSGYSNTGSYNTFVGYYAGYSTSGQYNAFFGAEAGSDNTTGGYNVFMGRSAVQSNTSGDRNTFLGYRAGYHHDTGSNNTFVGQDAGQNNTTGIGNVFIGKSAGYNETGDNKLYIHNSSSSEPLVLGDFNARTVVIHGAFRATASYSTSDRRWKQNISPLESSLEKVSSLQGVTYEWKRDVFPEAGFEKGKHIGLVAQDVEKALPELVSEDEDGYKGVSYTKLTAVLVEAIKELKAQNERQQVEINRLRALIETPKL